MEERGGAERILVSKPERRRQLGRPRHTWVNYIRIGLPEVGWGARTGLIWLRIQNHSIANHWHSLYYKKRVTLCVSHGVPYVCRNYLATPFCRMMLPEWR
jgi:hypothetical protein